ncbi:hypothetical protein FQR65_LT12465 [Abscondita terminalis]|nr:hypothetical protein FQR65_LT12465 [Abscondita terminalis]
MEGTEGELNMEILSTSMYDSMLNTDFISEEIIETVDRIVAATEVVVFFDLETSGLTDNCEILQIAAQYKDKTFSVYIKPRREIPPGASAVNGLTNVNGELYLGGVKVSSVPLIKALRKFLSFLIDINHPVVLTAHNCNFDAKVLLNSIKKKSMIKDFGSIVTGFADSLRLIQTLTGRTGKGMCTLSGLASWLNISTDSAHNAVYDVAMLAKIIESLSISTNLIIDTKINWSDCIPVLKKRGKKDLFGTLRKSDKSEISKYGEFLDVTNF